MYIKSLSSQVWRAESDSAWNVYDGVLGKLKAISTLAVAVLQVCSGKTVAPAPSHVFQVALDWTQCMLQAQQEKYYFCFYTSKETEDIPGALGFSGVM